MTSYLWLSTEARRRNVTDVEKQATNLVAWMTSLRVDFDNDLATLAGHDERSTAKLRGINGRKQVIDIMVKDDVKMLQNCIGKNDLLNEIIGGANDIPDGLSRTRRRAGGKYCTTGLQIHHGRSKYANDNAEELGSGMVAEDRRGRTGFGLLVLCSAF